MAFRWRADDGQTLIAGLVAVYIFMGSGPAFLRNPICLCFSGGRGSGPPAPPPPSGSAHDTSYPVIHDERGFLLKLFPSPTRSGNDYNEYLDGHRPVIVFHRPPL